MSDDGRSHILVRGDTLAAQIENALRHDILAGRLRPGERIRTPELTAQYGVSATPLREALQRLAVQNLIEIDPRFRATVAPVSAEDLRDIFTARILLEGVVLASSISGGDDQWLGGVHAAWERLSRAIDGLESEPSGDDHEEWADAHRHFHEVLLSACKSDWLKGFVRILYDHAERYRMLANWDPSVSAAESRHEHRLVYEATIRRDSESAGRQLASHLERTLGLLRDAFDNGA